MKRIALGLVLLLTLTTMSCEKSSNIDTKEVSSKALRLLKQNKFDTVLIVKTMDNHNEHINMFDTKHNFKGDINGSNDENKLMVIFFLIGVLLGLWIGLVIFN